MPSSLWNERLKIDKILNNVLSPMKLNSSFSTNYPLTSLNRGTVVIKQKNDVKHKLQDIFNAIITETTTKIC